MTTRRLAAILAADVAGFSAMMERDEEGTAARIRTLRTDVIEPALARHHGRLVKTTGDGFLAEFASPVEAVRSALAIQDQLSGDVDPVNLRIGINLGDIIIEDDGDVLGDGVNVAARLEQIAEPGGIAISGWVHDQVAGKIEGQFEDRGEQQVKNIARPVRVYALAGAAPSRSEAKALPLPDKPSIAVLPFTNMSGDPEQDYFCDGLVEDIITALSSVKWLFVIARNSSFTYKGRSVDVRQVGRELGVRYVLEGSIRKARGRLRITGQLIEAATGSHVWAERFDGALDDIFDLQDSVTESVAGAILPNIRSAEIARSRKKPTDSLDAYDLYLQALSKFASLTESDLANAIKLLYQAMQIDPNYGMAAALAAICYAFRVAQGWTTDGRLDTAEALRLADLALAAGKDNPEVLGWAGAIRAWASRDFASSKPMVDQAVEMCPSASFVWAVRGWTYQYADENVEAIRSFERAIRLSPRDIWLFSTLTGMGLATAKLGRLEEAIALFDKARGHNPNFSTTYRGLVTCLAQLGRIDQAREAARKLLALEPAFSVSDWFRRSGTGWTPQMVEGLCLAGLPE